MERFFLLLQLADSAFPVGGFAHSGGLEAAAQLGQVKGVASLLRYLVHSLEQAGTSALPMVTAAHAAPDRTVELARRYDAFLTNHIANRASRALGRAFLAAASAAFGTKALMELRVRARDEAGFPGHLPPVFGAVCALLGLTRDDAQRLFLFVQLRGLVSSAVRLNLVGPLEAQALQYRLYEPLESILSRCSRFDENNLATSAPIVDMSQGHHDRLYSRLFSS